MNTYRKSLYLIVLHKSYCVQRTNIQNLKAIHNVAELPEIPVLLCSKNEYTKSESNSQPAKASLYARFLLCSKNEYTKSESNSQQSLLPGSRLANCVQRTNIQNLKAIHNKRTNVFLPIDNCVQRTNIQNLKAIHNVGDKTVPKGYIVFKERIYKI